MTHTKDSIAALLARSDMAVYMALLALYNRQTTDERSAEDTKHQNRKGFNSSDARFGTSAAQQVIYWFSQSPRDRRYPYPLSRPQLEKARTMLRKYARQLSVVANERTAVTA